MIAALPNFDGNHIRGCDFGTAQGRETQFLALARCLSPHSTSGRPRLDGTPLGQAGEGTGPYGCELYEVGAHLNVIIRGIPRGANSTSVMVRRVENRTVGAGVGRKLLQTSLLTTAITR
jgi:hypothetical protein